MELKLFFSGGSPPGALDEILYRGELIRILSVQVGQAVFELNEELSVKAHMEALKAYLGGNAQVGTEELKEAPLLASVPKVWDSIFRKPQPVLDLLAWSSTEESDAYVYLPNTLRRSTDTEEYIANAHFTEVLTNAYRSMCKDLGIQPTAQLIQGAIIHCHEVRPYQGAQHNVVGERASRLANSRLVDFDDSPHAGAFLRALKSLRPKDYENEDVLRRVLAKVECILTGHTSITYNQKFIQRFFEKDSEPDGNIMAILKSMTVDGLVLSESLHEFRRRLIVGDIKETEELLSTFTNSARST